MSGGVFSSTAGATKLLTRAPRTAAAPDTFCCVWRLALFAADTVQRQPGLARCRGGIHLDCPIAFDDGLAGRGQHRSLDRHLDRAHHLRYRAGLPDNLPRSSDALSVFDIFHIDRLAAPYRIWQAIKAAR